MLINIKYIISVNELCMNTCGTKEGDLLIKWFITTFMQTTHISSSTIDQFAFYKMLSLHRERAVNCGGYMQYQSCQEQRD